MKSEWMPMIVSIALFVFGALFSVVGFLIKQAIVDFKKEVSGLRIDVVKLTSRVSDIVTGQSNIEARIQNDHNEILGLRKTAHDHANIIQEIRTIQKRCRTCNA